MINIKENFCFRLVWDGLNITANLQSGSQKNGIRGKVSAGVNRPLVHALVVCAVDA